METGYRNAWLYLLVLPPTIIAGFWIPYFSEFCRFDATITTAVHVHAFLLFAWLSTLRHARSKCDPVGHTLLQGNAP